MILDKVKLKRDLRSLIRHSLNSWVQDGNSRTSSLHRNTWENVINVLEHRLIFPSKIVVLFFAAL